MSDWLIFFFATSKTLSNTLAALILSDDSSALTASGSKDGISSRLGRNPKDCMLASTPPDLQPSGLNDLK